MEIPALGAGSAGVAGAVDAEGALGRRVEATGRDGLAAAVARAVGALFELHERPLDALLQRLELLSDAHLGEAVDRLRGSLSDSLPERDAAGVLRRLRQLLDLRNDLGQPLAQPRLDCLQIDLCGYFVALNSRTSVSQPSLPKVNFAFPVTLFLVASPITLS